MKKWMLFAAMLAGTTLAASGCLNSFWQGLWGAGWPNNPWLNIGLDVANEVVFG